MEKSTWKMINIFELMPDLCLSQVRYRIGHDKVCRSKKLSGGRLVTQNTGCKLTGSGQAAPGVHMGDIVTSLSPIRSHYLPPTLIHSNTFLIHVRPIDNYSRQFVFLGLIWAECEACQCQVPLLCPLLCNMIGVASFIFPKRTMLATSFDSLQWDRTWQEKSAVVHLDMLFTGRARVAFNIN